MTSECGALLASQRGDPALAAPYGRYRQGTRRSGRIVAALWPRRGIDGWAVESTLLWTTNPSDPHVSTANFIFAKSGTANTGRCRCGRRVWGPNRPPQTLAIVEGNYLPVSSGLAALGPGSAETNTPDVRGRSRRFGPYAGASGRSCRLPSLRCTAVRSVTVMACGIGPAKAART
jgi:hypothetical protein